MAQELPEEFRMKDLFLDVRLEACVNGSTFDFLGKKMFSAEFFRESIGFGITSIDIEINTSLQPLVTVVFKDLYGATVFGGQDRNPEDGLSIDYSVLFNWPPPKFLFSFKGYLGKPATWLLNLKRTSTSFNSSDGSYDIKCEFVPNQWGFFADMPFLYLLAAKRLRKDRLSGGETLATQKEVTSVFDLIKIGKQVEVKTQDTTKEFDDLVKQIGAMKSNIGRSLVVTNIVDFGEEILGVANNQPVKDFVTMQIPEETDLESIGNRLTIEGKLGQPTTLNAINAFILLSVKFNTGGKNDDGFSRYSNLGISRNWDTFYKNYQNTGSPQRLNIDSAVQQTVGILQKNLDRIDDEIKRRVFASSKTKLEKITISEIFSQMAKDAAFIMGSILDAGLDGYRGNAARQAARDSLGDILIGESFPLVLGEDGEELPAIAENLKGNTLFQSGAAGVSAEDIGVDNFEMKFVKNFINAISEGIAKDLLANNPQAGQDDSKLKQRVNNVEISSGNPYKSYYTNIATNILVRGGIAGYFTRSSDPNLPGDYGGDMFRRDRDDINSIQELAERDMQNVTDNILKNLSDVDFLLLRRFCVFFTNYFTNNMEGIADYDGDEAISLSPLGSGGVASFLSGGISNLISSAQNLASPPLDPTTWKVVMANPAVAQDSGGFGDLDELLEGNFLSEINSKSDAEIAARGIETLTFGRLWSELYTPAVLNDIDLVGDTLVFNDIEDIESLREDQIKGAEALVGEQGGGFNDGLSAAGIRNAQNPLSFVDTKTFTATRIVNNGIAYAFPRNNPNDYIAVFFEGEDNKRAQEANSAPTDAEYKNANKDDADLGQNEILGYVPINAKYGDDTDATQEVGNKGLFMLNRVASLMGYRRGTSGSAGGNVLNFTKLKNPGPGFYGAQSQAGTLFATNDLVWDGAILSDPNDIVNVSVEGRDIYYAGNIGWTVCSHIGSEADSLLVFGLFAPSQSGRNHRAFVVKAAEVLLEKIDGIIDERNQIIGEVLGKAGDNEAAIYKQMHTLFHQWQTLSYNDRIDGNNCLVGDPDEHKNGEGDDQTRVFNVAQALERRFGDNHVDLNLNETVTVTKEEAAEGMELSDAEFLELFPPGTDKIKVNMNDCAQAGSVPNGTFVYDYPRQRIEAPKDPVNVKDAIINLEPLYKPNADTSVLNIIQQVCTKNNFMFIPIPGNPGYLCVNEIYKPSLEPANLQVRNFFHVLFTPTPESRSKTKNADGTALGLSDKQSTYNVGSFVIRYGHPDNQIVNNIQVGTDDNKVTAESIVNLQRLVDNENQNKKVTTDCSMLPVLAGRSYKASVDMIGNSQVYPMQFFFLENSPLFGGLYQVMKVKHAISPNNMTTSLSGIRMRFSPGDGYGSIKPITLATFADLGPSEAPLAIAEGFDKADRDALSNFSAGLGSVAGNRVANQLDYINQDFVDGECGGPVARPVDVLPQNVLNSFDTSLGVRDLWATGKIIGSEQMYIFDKYPMTAQVTSAYKAMKEAAKADGVDLRLRSGYRDPFQNIKAADGSHISTAQYNLRIKNVKDKTKKNDDNYLRTASSGKFDPATARPGYSNHNSGLAIDLNCGGAKFNNFNQEIYEWLMLNAYKYGFVRTVTSEEWHWEYRPGKAMFQFDCRSGSKWYDLPDKLGIPLNKPTTGSTLGSGPLQDTLTAAKKAVVDKIIAQANKAGIKDKNRLFALLVVARKESNFTVLTESFNYDLAGVKATFGNYGGNNRRGDKTDKVMLEHYIPKNRVPADTNPKYGSEKKLADLLYGGRKYIADKGINYQNGKDEGWKYRGRGMTQITFKSNYKKMNQNIKKYFNENIDLVANPDLASNEDIAIKCLIAGKLGQQFGAFNTSLDFLNSIEAVHRSNHGTNPNKQINQATFKHTTDSYNQLKNDSYIVEKLSQFPDYA